jgi:hypothetical protein
MRTNTYTKLVLAVIALALFAIAGKVYISSRSTKTAKAVQTGKELAATVPAIVPWTTTVTPGVYEFQSGIPYNGSRGMCWNVVRHQIQQLTCSGYASQQFRIVDDIDANANRTISFNSDQGLAHVTAVGTNGLLGALLWVVTPGPIHTSEGDIPVGVARWRFDDVPQGSGRRYIVEPGSGLCIDRPTDAMNEGDRVQLYTCAHTQGQQWILVRVGN